jgi:hypothetical protein
VSAFLGLAVLAAIGLWRSRIRVWGLPALFCTTFLFCIVILNKSAGSLLFVLLIGGMLAWLSGRRFLTAALAFGLILVAYPALRASNLVPVAAIQSAASSYSAQRADSLNFRLRNEDILLERARARPWFGWGGYDRNRVFVVTDWGQTLDVSVTDGTWVITLGTSGWFGYISLFGLLCYPFWHLYRRRRRVEITPATIALVAMLLFNLFDLIPNSSLRPVTWLIAGALAGFSGVRTTRETGRAKHGAMGAAPLGPSVPS